MNASSTKASCDVPPRIFEEEYQTESASHEEPISGAGFDVGGRVSALSMESSSLIVPVDVGIRHACVRGPQSLIVDYGMSLQRAALSA